MKVITIKQPWASLVVEGHKTIETRSWATKYRGDILIHAGVSNVKKIVKSMPISFWDRIKDVGLLTPDLPYGAIIGCVTIIDVQLMEAGIEEWMNNSNSDNEQEYAFGDWREGRYAWHLENPILFKHSIPCKGQLGLWNFDFTTLLRK